MNPPKDENPMGAFYKMNEIFRLIRNERARQDNRWGVQDHDPYRWLAILVEEIGETGKAILENEFSSGPGHTPDHIAVELLQSAAVIVAFLECLDRHDEIKLETLSLDA